MVHALFLTAFVGWGHVRPEFHLCLNLLRQHPNATFTLVCEAPSGPRLQRELDTHYPIAHPNGLGQAPAGKTSASVRDRTQIVPLAESLDLTSGGMDAKVEACKNAVTPIIEALLHGAPTVEGKENKWTEKVSVVFGDLFIYPFPGVVRRIAEAQGGTVPYVSFMPVTAGMTNRYLVADIKNVVHPRKASGHPLDPNKLLDEDIQGSAWNKGEGGEVVQVEGKHYYEYEFYPMATVCPMPPDVVRTGLGSAIAFEADGPQALILSWDRELEPIEAAKVDDGLGKDLIMIGPQYPESFWGGPAPTQELNDESKKVLGWLDQMTAKHGERSVAYFSFGQAFFPWYRQELLAFILESLTAAGIPWLYPSASAPWVTPPPEILEIVEKAGGNALITKFAPQWEVLNHLATRFYVCHCGSNSGAEAILAGVPMVGIPFAADQIDIAHLFENKGCGITLHQVAGFKHPEKHNQLYDGTVIVGSKDAILQEAAGVWARLKDVTEWERMRAGVLRLREVLTHSRESGASRKAMDALGKYFA